jgi:hypothetical protein
LWLKVPATASADIPASYIPSAKISASASTDIPASEISTCSTAEGSPTHFSLLTCFSFSFLCPLL